jgi:hypothetical protein
VWKCALLKAEKLGIMGTRHLRIPQMATILSFLLLAIYGAGAWKFWNGFNRTNFSQSRLILTVLWPVMLASASYRKNFVKALKG